MRIALIFIVFFIALGVQSVAAQGLRFALVPKQTDVPFFKEIEAGCLASAQKLENVSCLYKGPQVSDFRLQDKIISDMIDQGVDGIAVSVINSDYLAENSLKKAKMRGIPVITFDSDLSSDVLKRDQNLRAAYVGTNNREMGRLLAQGLIKLKEKGIYSLISGNPTAPNLIERMDGFREVMSKTAWKEFFRSPVHINDNPERSIKVLDFMYSTRMRDNKSLDAVVAMGAFLQSRYDEYRAVVLNNAKGSSKNDLLIISADTSPHQLKLVEQGLSDLNVGQNTFQMGFKAIELLHQIHNKAPVAEINYTSLKLCKPNGIPLCQFVGS